MVQSQQVTHILRGTERCDKGLNVPGGGGGAQRHVGVLMTGVVAVFLSVSRQESAEYHSLDENSFPSDTSKFINKQTSHLLWLYNLALLAPSSNK